MPAMPGLAPVLPLLSLLAMGCAANGGDEATAMMQHALASTHASLALAGEARPAPVTGPASASRPAGPATVQPILTPGAARPRGAAPPAAAAALVGVTADQLRRMLGEPTIRRPEGPAEVWLYEAPACRLDVILYAEGARLVVGHAAARALGDGAGVTESACLSAVAAAPVVAPWATSGPRA